MFEATTLERFGLVEKASACTNSATECKICTHCECHTQLLRNICAPNPNVARVAIGTTYAAV